MSDIENRIKEIKDKTAQAQARRARAQMESAAASEALQRHREALESEFGVSTPDQAREALRGLQVARDEALSRAEELLDGI